MARVSGVAPVRARRVELNQVRRKLKARLTSQRVAIGAMLLFGVPLLFLGPTLIAALVWVKTVGHVPFISTFTILSVMLIPLFMLAEIASSGKFRDRVVDDYGDVTYDTPGTRGGGQMVALIIFCSLGPGLIMGAVRRIRGQMRHRAGLVDRCAELAAQLLAYDGGVDIFTLQKPGESFDDLLTAIEWLVHYDWVGAGSKGQRIWILGDARRALEA